MVNDLVENPGFCSKCDSPLLGVLHKHYFYQCGRLMNGSQEGKFVVFTCLHEGRLDKTRCRADTGRPMISFKAWLEARA